MSANTPDLTRRAYARTNLQTIGQRAALLRALVPNVRSIAELCCGDCRPQAALYRRALGITSFRGLELVPAIVTMNRQHGVDCVLGDALDPAVLGQFLAFEVTFFGPPLSAGCDGHSILAFNAVTPPFAAFAQLFLAALRYQGLLVCIAPNTTTMGDVRRLYQQVRAGRPDVGLAAIHYSYATVTGLGQSTAARLKYVELWFSPVLGDQWQVWNSGQQVQIAPERIDHEA